MAKMTTAKELWDHTPVPTYDFMDRAREFLGAYHELKPKTLSDWPRHLMLGQAVELALGAYALSRGMDKDTLYSHKHDLRPLLDFAKGKGLAVSADVDKDIGEHMHKVHSLYLSRFPKYEGQMSKGVVAIEGLEASAIRLIADISAALVPVVKLPPGS